jgi:excisionase family DNA binding protein
MGNQFLSLRQAAVITNVSYMTIYRMVRTGEISSIRFGRLYRIKPEALGLPNPEDKAPTIHPIESKTNEPPNGSSFFEQIRPELERAFQYLPPFGEVGFRVILHEGKAVRIEYSIAKSELMNPQSPQTRKKQN